MAAKKTTKAKDVPKKKSIRELSDKEIAKVSGGVKRAPTTGSGPHRDGDEVVQSKGGTPDYG